MQDDSRPTPYPRGRADATHRQQEAALPRTEEVEQVDYETGEITSSPAVVGQESQQFIVAPKRRPAMDERFTMVVQEYTEELLDRLSPGAAKMLLRVYCSFEWSNVVTVNISQLARRWNVKRDTVASWLRELEDVGVLMRQETGPGRAAMYTVNPHAAWRGKRPARAEAVEQWEQQRDKRRFEDIVSRLEEDDSSTQELPDSAPDDDTDPGVSPSDEAP